MHGERDDRDRRLPQLPGQHEVGDEDERHELDPCRQADARALPPAPVGLAEIPDDQEHQQRLHLTQVQGALHRLGPQRDRAEAERRGCPLPPAPAERAERQPGHRKDRREAGHRHQPGQDRPGQQGRAREDQRREGRVGKPDSRLQLPAVERR
jgi:hypothetical protein